MPMEFTVARSRNKQNDTLVEGGLLSTEGIIIISEFVSSARVMRGGIMINPWRTEEVKGALLRVLEMCRAERADRMRSNLEFSTRLTTTNWTLQVLQDLKSVEKSDDVNSYSAMGFGMGFRVMGLKSGFELVDTLSLTKSYRNAHSRLIILDWGGTLGAENDKVDKLQAYAIAQGNVVVGGLGVTGADNSSLTVNIPTVGRIPRGASVERIVPTEFLNTDFIILNLHRGDFSTAYNVSEAINNNFGTDTAIPLDTNSIRVRAPSDPSQKVAFVSLLENIEVDRAVPPAKIIVNSRTGTLVISGNVKVTPAAVSHGTLSVRVNEDQNIDGGDAIAIGEGAEANAGAAAVPDTEIEVQEDVAKAFLFDAGVSLSDLVDAINAVGATPSDLVAILEALREAGALNAELIVI